MRRKDREITDRELISQIIRKAEVCRLGLVRNNVPYIVPISFGYDGNALYFHTALEGKKIDYFQASDTVCFEFDTDVKLLPDKTRGCKWSVAFRSVIGYGRITELTEKEEMIDGLNQILLHYSGRKWPIDESELANVRVWKIQIEHLSGKQAGY